MQRLNFAEFSHRYRYQIHRYFRRCASPFNAVDRPCARVSSLRTASPACPIWLRAIGWNPWPLRPCRRMKIKQPVFRHEKIQQFKVKQEKLLEWWNTVIPDKSNSQISRTEWVQWLPWLQWLLNSRTEAWPRHFPPRRHQNVTTFEFPPFPQFLFRRCLVCLRVSTDPWVYVRRVFNMFWCKPVAFFVSAQDGYEKQIPLPSMAAMETLEDQQDAAHAAATDAWRFGSIWKNQKTPAVIAGYDWQHFVWINFMIMFIHISTKSNQSAPRTHPTKGRLKLRQQPLLLQSWMTMCPRSKDPSCRQSLDSNFWGVQILI